MKAHEIANKEELINALRYCPSHGCGRCVAVDANGVCTLHGVVGIMNSAADALEEMSNDIEKHYIPLLESWQKRAQSRLLKIQEMKKETEELLSETANVVKENERLKAQLPKDGEWMPVGDGTIYVKCSVCGEEMCCRGHYCPNCGSVMKG